MFNTNPVGVTGIVIFKASVPFMMEKRFEQGFP